MGELDFRKSLPDTDLDKFRADDECAAAATTSRQEEDRIRPLPDGTRSARKLPHELVLALSLTPRISAGERSNTSYHRLVSQVFMIFHTPRAHQSPSSRRDGCQLCSVLRECAHQCMISYHRRIALARTFCKLKMLSEGSRCRSPGAIAGTVITVLPPCQQNGTKGTEMVTKARNWRALRYKGP